MVNWFLFCILAYVFLQLVICFFITRRMKSEQDYMLAGRSLGIGFGAMTIFATWFGAETCIGSSGAIYADGLSGSRADPFGYAMCIFILGIFFARKLWARKLTTLGDFFRQRFGPEVEKVAVLLLVPTSVIWAAAQIRALGQVLAAGSDIHPEFAIAFAASIVIAYTVFGGLLADVVADVIQGVVLIIGLSILAVAVLLNWPDPDLVAEALSPERLQFKSPDESWLAVLDGWSIPIIGSLFSAELVTRMLASRSANTARNAAITGGIIYVCVGLLPVLFGLLGPALIPGVVDPEHMLPELAQKLLHPALFIIFAGAIVSAILSTVDSALLAAGSLVSHNIIVPLNPKADERDKVRYARLSVFTFGVIAYFMASGAESVYGLVEEASAFGSAGVFTCCLMGLSQKHGGKITATASLIMGMATYVIGAHWYEYNYAYLLSLVVAFCTFCSLMLFEPGRDTFVEEPEAA